MLRTLLIIIITSLSAISYGQNFNHKIDPKLLESNGIIDVVLVLSKQASIEAKVPLKGKHRKAKYVYNKLMKTAELDQQNIVEILERKKVAFRQFYIVNMISATIDKELLFELAKMEEIASIIEDAKFEMLPIQRDNGSEQGARAIEWGVAKINAPDVWTAGYTGQNVVIGGQDTGYEWDHSAIKDQYRGWDGVTEDHDYNWHDAIHTATGNPCGTDATAPCDDHNHGTHTMGTMVGDDGGANEIGVAPGAKWIGCRNMDEGNGVLSTYVECFEWFLAPYPIGQTPAQGDPSKAPHVINNSWSCPISEGCNTSNYAIMETVLNNLRSSGVVIVVSNGNSGSGCSTTFSPPAIFENSFSIGATTSSDVIAGFSSRGPVLVDGSNRLKPEVSAPGQSVRSCIRNGNYTTYSGTSMAGPHVAGAVALIISANPDLAGEVDQIEQILRETAVPKTTTQNCGGINGTDIPNNTYGFGRIDALAAVERAQDLMHVPFIKIDQFGYLPEANKIAIFSDPITGFNDSLSYTPPSNVYVKDAFTHATVHTGTAAAWDSGNEDPLSGDKVWWYDFSSLQTSGTYYISDNSIISENFEINEDVYDDVLEAGFKTFYLQRCGHNTTLPYTTSGYVDGLCHGQDANCKFINDPTNPARELDLSGGWHDAGDYNKYVNFAHNAVIDLLFSYEYNPEAWNDDMNIPESGNGIPDLLDELKYELDWLLKMQQTDGGVLCVVGVENFASASPPSADNATRYYGPRTTAASFSAASMTAAAALQFRKINNTVAQAYATTLETKAIEAYTWAINNPNQIYNNSGIIAAGEQQISGYDLEMRQLMAAMFLSELTGTSSYTNYAEANYDDSHLLQWNFAYPFEHVLQQALLYYAYGTEVSTATASDIINTYKNSIETSGENLPSITNEDDAYRAYLKSADIGWGSNRTKSAKGNMYQSYFHYDINTSNDAVMRNSIDDFVHYIHGVNPVGYSYLTNMSEFGASKSINTVYHGWFEDGSLEWDDVRSSSYGPAPGFLTGGPNSGWGLDGCCTGSCSGNALCVNQMPPNGQPQLKSYHDWNTGWPQNSWSVTEPAIYYQAAYLNLLSSRVNTAQPIVGIDQVINIDNVDVVISNDLLGAVLKSPNGSLYKLVIDNAGNLGSTDIISIVSGSTIAQNSSIYIEDVNKGLILKLSTGDHWRITIDNSGRLTTVLIPSLSTEKAEIVDGDLVIDNINQGLILRDDTGNCFKIEVNDSGTLYTIAVRCP
jgi:subtilisin family serine protease